MVILLFGSVAYAMYTAPTMDDNGNVTKPGKKITDLFK